MLGRQRLDHYLSKKYPDISRGFLQKLIATEQVLVNGKPEKSGFKLHRDDTVKMLYDLKQVGKVPKLDLPIIYEDDDVLVVDKPAGVLSHALTKFHNEPSVASFLRQHITSSGEDYDLRFGIVHRLDRATSGVMICAKNQENLSFLQQQFSKKTVKKIYTAIVSGIPKEPEALLDLPIERNPKAPATYRVGQGGKKAQTIYKVIKSDRGRSLVELKPKTGRTHQLRVHLKHIGHPIVGDKLYGGKPADRLYLHASELSIKLPDGQVKSFQAPLPDEFNQLMEGSK